MSYLFNQEKAKNELKTFFSHESADLKSFGNKVNQTFEAYTLMKTVKWFEANGWRIKIVNPKIKGANTFRLKFSTRGAPSNFSHFICKKDNDECQIRHQLRVATKKQKNRIELSSNICCDIVILKNIKLEGYSTNSAIPNEDLISFGEVKHMSAFAELIAGFIGMVHELQPKRLKRVRIGTWSNNGNISPYMNVSGKLFTTAKALKETIEQRKYDIDIYSDEKKL